MEESSAGIRSSAFALLPAELWGRIFERLDGAAKAALGCSCRVRERACCMTSCRRSRCSRTRLCHSLRSRAAGGEPPASMPLPNCLHMHARSVRVCLHMARHGLLACTHVRCRPVCGACICMHVRGAFHTHMYAHTHAHAHTRTTQGSILKKRKCRRRPVLANFSVGLVATSSTILTGYVLRHVKAGGSQGTGFEPAGAGAQLPTHVCISRKSSELCRHATGSVLGSTLVGGTSQSHQHQQHQQHQQHKTFRGIP